ncbi:MAG: LamG domain-containing protein [Candidatus Micrarchaeia archaeon]
MERRGQGSFEYVLMIAGVVLVLTVIVVVLQNQATGSSQAVEQNVEHHELVACMSTEVFERSKSLVASWHFDEESGTVAGDSSGNGNLGTIIGTVDVVKGKIGNARNFDNSADRMSVAVIDLPDDPGSQWTIEAWFKYPFPSDFVCYNTLTRGVVDHQVIVDRCGGSFLGTFSNTVLPYFFSSGFDTDTLSDGWHHLAAVGQGGQTAFYIDGELVGTSAWQSTSDVVSIGNFQSGTQPFGTIDEVKIYSRALSVDEIKADMNCEVRL